MVSGFWWGLACCHILAEPFLYTSCTKSTFLAWGQPVLSCVYQLTHYFGSYWRRDLWEMWSCAIFGLWSWVGCVHLFCLLCCSISFPLPYLFLSWMRIACVWMTCLLKCLLNLPWGGCHKVRWHPLNFHLSVSLFQYGTKRDFFALGAFSWGKIVFIFFNGGTCWLWWQQGDVTIILALEHVTAFISGHPLSL